MHHESDKSNLEPLRERKLLALLASWNPLEEDFPEIEDRLAESEDIFGQGASFTLLSKS